ncbi:hypothetical protein PIB30_012288 [Stylosanthes scabra]|uniref:Uncharacterized protein n=1 Tax=Stylosanthes scabra TaxID=79078 RepID=A0ABU6Y665_9FABA|nr:hypothetical protein [Stylosanthes scabra]
MFSSPSPIALVKTQKKKRAWLRRLWRKIKREKKRFLMSSSSTVVHFQYDPSSYSQNFDDGYSTDPDCISRSFSSRFAALPSKIFHKNHAQMVDHVDKDNKFKSSKVV